MFLSGDNQKLVCISDNHPPFLGIIGCQLLQPNTPTESFRKTSIGAKHVYVGKVREQVQGAIR
jgi:hypothetical protein